MVTTLNQIAQKMQRIPHFKGLKLEEIINIVRSGSIDKYPKDEIILHENFDCFGICVLLKGEIYLYRLGPEGQENIIAVIEPVIMFNEVAALDGGPNPVTAVAAKDSLVWHADYKTFQYGLQKYPQLGLGLLPVLARRNREILTKYCKLSFLDVKERMAALLLELSDEGKEVIDRRGHSIQHMAAHIVTSPALISRIIGEFKAEGLISASRQSIKVENPTTLEKVSFGIYE
ncbi:MAG: Crp/Fnr family transcriptional regulator [Anaerolineales bacterium]|nr:Crp/Fnr family transcriptional regulator [Anaerolineales bacterium]